jgi:hypothetical protein
MKKLLLLAIALTLVARPASAQVTVDDIDAMVKWMEYEVVHYKFVGDYSGSFGMLNGANKAGFVPVGSFTDRIEVEFDWNQKEHVLVGKPVIRNFPSKLVKSQTQAGCQSKVDGAVEVATALELKADGPEAGIGYLMLVVRRDLPGGSFILMGDGGPTICGSDWANAAPTPTNSTLGIWAASPTLLFTAAQTGMKITPDKKSMIVPPDMAGPTRNDGWTWTITPTGVK